MIVEALEDEGASADVFGSHLRALASRSQDVLISARDSRGRSHFDLPTPKALGFHTDEFEGGGGEGGYSGGTYVYTTDVEPKPLAEEARALAAAVNRTVRGATGSTSAVLVACPLVGYLDTAGMKRVSDEHQERIRQIAAGAERNEDRPGCLLLRESTNATMDLYALKDTLDRLWCLYTESGPVPHLKRELLWHDVRPYMIKAALGAVHDRWTSPRTG